MKTIRYLIDCLSYNDRVGHKWTDAVVGVLLEFIIMIVVAVITAVVVDL